MAIGGGKGRGREEAREERREGEGAEKARERRMWCTRTETLSCLTISWGKDAQIQ